MQAVVKKVVYSFRYRLGPGQVGREVFHIVLKSIGIVALNVQLENDISSRVELKDTLYVTDLRNNLLSVSCVTNNDYL